MKIIKTTSELEQVCAALSQDTFITVDTEFMRETTFWPVLCLIQMAGSREEVIVDPLAEGISLSPFFDLMQKKSVLKVFHAARQDLEIIYKLSGALPTPLFDTQIAAMVCGFGDQVGYENLIKTLVGARIDKSSRFTDWSRRPLTDTQLAYALSDVTHLRQAYEKINSQIQNSGRGTWVASEMEILLSPSTYKQEPEFAWKRVKARLNNRRSVAILMEVAKWREIQAQKRDRPRNRILKDDALAEIAIQKPSGEKALSRLRAVPKGFVGSKYAQGLIEAIEKGLKCDVEDIPDPSKRASPPPQNTGPIVEVLKVALKVVCETHNVAPKLIATVADLEKIASDDKADVQALKGWRREIFGEQALQLKRGELCIGLEGDRVALLKRTHQA